MPVDEQGLDMEHGQQPSREARLIWTTPSHQFPTGVPMSLFRRLALLEWARQSRAWILEDDYDSEYRWSGRPLESLQGLDSAGRVIYIKDGVYSSRGRIDRPDQTNSKERKIDERPRGER